VPEDLGFSGDHSVGGPAYRANDGDDDEEEDWEDEEEEQKKGGETEEDEEEEGEPIWTAWAAQGW
jgi:hypothetical protein